MAGNVALNGTTAGAVRGILIPMQPSLDQLTQTARTLAHDYDFVRVVLVSTQGGVQADAQFIEVSDGPEFRTDLHQALRDGLTALGLLGWEFKDGTLQDGQNLGFTVAVSSVQGTPTRPCTFQLSTFNTSHYPG